MNKFWIILIGITTLSGCNNGLDGDCSENIPLSTKTVNFTSSPDAATVTTGDNKWWWLNGITVDGVEYYDFEDLDVMSANYSLKVDSLTFERKEGTTIFLKVGENAKSTNRKFSISLQDGNCFNYIEINQSSN